MNELNRQNFRLLLAAWIENNELTVRKVAKGIGCSEATLKRILDGKTLPSDEMLKHGGLALEVGWEVFRKLSQSQKENFSASVGTVGGGILGFGSITAAIASLGFPGLSAAGISSGLATFGTIVGGGMAAGVIVAAAIPIAAGTAGYGIIKAVKYFAEEHELNSDEYDPDWEMPQVEQSY